MSRIGSIKNGTNLYLTSSIPTVQAGSANEQAIGIRSTAFNDSGNLHEETMAQWINLANLMELKGMALEMAELLLSTGIASLKQLGESIPENLHQRLGEENDKKKLLARAPLFDQVAELIVLARISVA